MPYLTYSLPLHELCQFSWNLIKGCPVLETCFIFYALICCDGLRQRCFISGNSSLVTCLLSSTCLQNYLYFLALIKTSYAFLSVSLRLTCYTLAIRKDFNLMAICPMNPNRRSFFQSITLYDHHHIFKIKSLIEIIYS